MTYKIIGDSCLDLTEELKKDPHFQMIPLTLQVGDVHVTDDETFDQRAFLELVRNTEDCRRRPVRLRKALRRLMSAMRRIFL